MANLEARNRLVFHCENMNAKLIVDKAQQEWFEYENETEVGARTNGIS